MLEEDKSGYLEYLSIAFCVLSFCYFSNVCYQKFYNNKINMTENSLKNFDIYNTIIKKYNGKVIDFKIVNGYVEAFIEKNEFNYDDFDYHEPYQIEEFDENYLITFKSVKNNSEKKILIVNEKKEQKFDINKIKINSFCYINKSDWSISINNVNYSNNQLKINEDCCIISVSESFIILNYKNTNIKIYL